MSDQMSNQGYYPHQAVVVSDMFEDVRVSIDIFEAFITGGYAVIVTHHDYANGGAQIGNSEIAGVFATLPEAQACWQQEIDTTSGQLVYCATPQGVWSFPS